MICSLDSLHQYNHCMLDGTGNRQNSILLRSELSCPLRMILDPCNSSLGKSLDTFFGLAARNNPQYIPNTLSWKVLHKNCMQNHISRSYGGWNLHSIHRHKRAHTPQNGYRNSDLVRMPSKNLVLN